MPGGYKVSTKIIMSNDNVVCAVHVFKDGFTDTPIIGKLQSASSNQVPGQFSQNRNYSNIRNNRIETIFI